ncbi:hypothetical protein C9374_011672 [Naegleria lovaniensis]|uniref:Uncharacterized protein n=1 Tax=Naegleria lovaniensis TaxID=51637 RepID=A0AA88GEA0_NAELO|nr:uncharacterized protein C9374_011672 [Naegleria lovaniensis]KAG2374007.1 hypothetical protein C9374_011672 [Naegleria lovaniensis]
MSSLQSNQFANVTVDYYLPVWAASMSIGNSVLYICCFIIYLLFLAVFIFRVSRRNQAQPQQQQLKKNHKILFSLVVIQILIQCLNLSVRIIGDSMAIRMRQIAESGQLVEWNFFLATNILTGLATFFMFTNFITLFVILFFVQKMFWKTALLTRAISKTAHRRIEILMNVVTVLFCIVVELIVSLATTFYILRKLEMISKTTAIGVYVGCIVIVLGMLLFDTVMAVTSGVLVIKTIKQTTREVSKSAQLSRVSSFSSDFKTFEKRVQSPFKITFGLLLGLIICVFLEMVAVALSQSINDFENFKSLWHFVNCLGVLLFAVLVLCLFYPMFAGTDRAIMEIEKRQKHFMNALNEANTNQLLSNVTLNTSASGTCHSGGSSVSGVVLVASSPVVSSPSSTTVLIPENRNDQAVDKVPDSSACIMMDKTKGGNQTIGSGDETLLKISENVELHLDGNKMIPLRQLSPFSTPHDSTTSSSESGGDENQQHVPSELKII